MDSWMYAPSGANQNGGHNSFDRRTPTVAETQPAPCPASPNSNEISPKNNTLHATRIRRRNRLITSCLECRRRKLKCDKQAPCTNCLRFKRDCLYIASSLDPQSQQKLADIKEKMGALEKNLEREVAGKTLRPQSSNSAPGTTAHVSGEDIKTEESDDEADFVNTEDDVLEPTPLAAMDNVYGEGADDELMDLGVQMGKMRLSERIGGWTRPKLVEELTDTLEDVKIGKLWNNFQSQESEPRDPHPAPPRIQASPKSYIGPSPDYIAPAPSFFFPGTNMNTSLTDYLPSKAAADQLISQYWAAVHYMCKTVHRPTFEAQYALFWGQIAMGNEPAPPIQAIIFAAMFSAAVSFTNPQVAQFFGTSKTILVDSLRSGTEMALAKANLLRTTRVDTMQAFVMYLIPLVRAEVSRAHSALVGTAIRLAECMGLHRDGSFYNMKPVEVHVRRMIWFQLCFLDVRTCEATGPRPQIRRDDYDTKFPLNVDDEDLLETEPRTEDKSCWTDMTLMRFRAESYEFRRQLWFDILAVDKKKKSLTSVLVRTQQFVSLMQEKYLPMIDDSVPFQALGRLLITLTTHALYTQVLHRYMFSGAQRMPDRLRQVLINAGLVQLESAMEIDTRPELQPWAWYRGAFHQYHSALLLMIEVYAFPMRKEAARIWKTLDYIFEIPPHLAPKQKAELVFTDLRDRMEVYHQMRKLKVSNQMEQYAGRGNMSYFRRNGVDWSRAETGEHAVHSVGIPGDTVVLPTSFSPALHNDSQTEPSRQGSAPASIGEMGPTELDNIDWAEWDKAFNPEINNGEINVPDFNMADFTGDFNASPVDSSNFNFISSVGLTNSMSRLGHMGLSVPSTQDLNDFDTSPTLIPNQPYNC